MFALSSGFLFQRYRDNNWAVGAAAVLAVLSSAPRAGPMVAGNPSAAYLRATMRAIDVRDAGRLGAIAPNKKLSKRKRRENARKAAKAR